MAVEYQVTGRCPTCRKSVALLDADDPVPPHRGRGTAPCEYRGEAESTSRKPAKASPNAETGRRSEAKALTRKQKKRARRAQVAKVIRDGNRRLYGDQLNPRSISVKTISGGLPTLGK